MNNVDTCMETRNLPEKEMFLRPNFIALNSFHDLETYMPYKLVIYLVLVNFKKKKKKKKIDRFF